MASNRRKYFTGAWYPWYPDLMRESERVAKLSLAEEAAYRRALDKQWMKGSLPADPKEFALQVGKNCTVKMAMKILQFFAKKRGSKNRVVNFTLEEIRSEQAKIFKQHSEAGKKGMASRWGKKTSDDNAVNNDDSNPLLTKNNRREEKRRDKIRRDKKRREEEAAAENSASAVTDPTEPRTVAIAPGDTPHNVLELIKLLQTQNRYSRIDIPNEIDKAHAWAIKHNVKPTNQYFQNWLDRIHQPDNPPEGGKPNGKYIHPRDAAKIDERRGIEEIRARVADRDRALHRPDDPDS